MSMRTPIRVALTLGVALLSALRPSAGSDSPPLSTGAVIVVVENFKTHERVHHAHVFVLGEDGHLLAEAWTDALGSARLPSLAPGAKPKYLLAEGDWFFLVGRRWLPGQLEYLMPLLPLTPPGVG